jgi:glycosyltransferase involved in cell wall biosynthesis
MSEARRKILVVLSTVFCARGGIPRFNQLLCRAIDEAAPGLGLEGVVVSQDDTVDDYEKHAAWSRLRFVAGGSKGGTARATLSRVVTGRPDLVLIGHLGMTPLGLAGSPFARRGYAFVAHGTEAWNVPRRSRRLAARRARYAWVVSSYTGEMLARETGLDPDRVRLLPNALEPGLEELPTGDTSEATPPEVLSVSRLAAEEGQKGIDHMIEAFARLGSRHPDVVYRVVGRGSDKPRLVELARERGLEDRVVFEQDLSDEELADRYRRCTLFALPSGQEGFGIVFLEAMRFGKPCIGGNAGGTPEVVADGDTGLLVPFGDEDALVGALDRLLGDSELRQAMGRSGRDRLREQFVFARYKENVARLLGEWLEARAP